MVSATEGGGCRNQGYALQNLRSIGGQEKCPEQAGRPSLAGQASPRKEEAVGDLLLRQWLGCLAMDSLSTSAQEVTTGETRKVTLLSGKGDLKRSAGFVSLPVLISDSETTACLSSAFLLMGFGFLLQI